MADTSSRKKSPIWDYYTIGEDAKFAICKSCGKAVSRSGNSAKVYNTTNLVSHLKSAHPESHEAYQVKYQRQQEKEKADKSATTKTTSKQLSLEDVQEKVRI